MDDDSSPLVHELHIINQIVHLQPPVEKGCCRLLGQLHEWINTIAALSRIQSSRYQVGMEKDRGLGGKREGMGGGGGG